MTISYSQRAYGLIGRTENSEGKKTMNGGGYVPRQQTFI
jgi:hypothetical protein